MSEDIRRGIIDTIVQNGGDHISVFFGGSYSDVARKFNVSRQSAKNVWKKFVDSGEIGPRDKKGAQNPPNLTGTELEIIEFLKRDSPSMTWHFKSWHYTIFLGDLKLLRKCTRRAKKALSAHRSQVKL